MNAQLSLVYSPATVGADAWSAQLEAIRAAVNHLGLKDVAYTLDISGSGLSDALNERDRKRWAAQWTHVVLSMLNARRGDEIAQQLKRTIAGAALVAAELELAGDDSISDDEMKAALAAIANTRRSKKKAGR